MVIYLRYVGCVLCRRDNTAESPSLWVDSLGGSDDNNDVIALSIDVIMYLLIRQVATPSSSELAATTTTDRLRPMQGMIKPARSSSAQQERSKLLREAAYGRFELRPTIIFSSEHSKHTASILHYMLPIVNLFGSTASNNSIAASLSILFFCTIVTGDSKLLESFKKWQTH